MVKINLIYRKFRARRGASLTGYGLVVGLIAVIAIVATSNVGSQVTSLFSDVGDTLTDTASGVSGSGIAARSYRSNTEYR